MLGIDRQARAAAALQRSGIRNSEKHDGFQVAKKHDLRGRHRCARGLQVCNFTADGKGDESKCPVARMVDFGRRQLSSQTFEHDPYTSADYQGDYRMGMGLSPMKPENWIEIDEEYEDDIELRRKLLAEQRDIVLQSTPEADDANQEMLDLLVDFLPRRYPDRFVHTPDNKLQNLATGDEFDLNHPDLDPLEVSSLLVQEDLCLMKADSEGVLRFVSGAVLFPQRWSLLEKIGMDMHRIHVPVPLFEQEIERPVAAFMNRLEVKRPFWRCNWTISDNPDKFQPLVEADIEQVNAGINLNSQWQAEPITAQNAGTRLVTRMERETLSRFPKSRAILFTIRTHMKPLERFQQMPKKARQLTRALKNLHPSIAQYKTIAAFREQALEYLDGIADENGVAKVLPIPEVANQI